MGEIAVIVLSITQAGIVGAILFYLYRKEKNHSLDEGRNLSAYLKHIQQLEKIVIEDKTPKAPKIDENHIKEILMRGPEKADNEIAKSDQDMGIELNENNFKNVPFGPNTNVLIEGDMPTTIE